MSKINSFDEQPWTVTGFTAHGLGRPDELKLSPHQWSNVAVCLSLSMKRTGPPAPLAGSGVHRKVV